MKNTDNLAYLTGSDSVANTAHSPEAPALEVCFRQVIGQAQDITLRTYLPNDAPVSAFNAMMDKMGDVANRLSIKRELDAMLAEREREAQTLTRLEINETTTRLEAEKQLAAEKVTLNELVLKLSDEEHDANDIHHASGRTGTQVIKGARASRINAYKAAVEKQKSKVSQLEAEFAANRKNHQENLAAWKMGQEKFDKDIAALKAALG